VLDELGECLDRCCERVDAARGSAHDQGALEYGHDQVGQVGRAPSRDVPCFELACQRLAPSPEDLIEVAAQLGLGEDLRAAAFISLGIAEMWVLKIEDAERHLQRGMALARQIGRPYLELTGLAHGAHAMLLFRGDLSQAKRSWQAIELAERHGWCEEPLAGMAYAQVGFVLLYQGRLDDWARRQRSHGSQITEGGSWVVTTAEALKAL
jgi:hypothetical protein